MTGDGINDWATAYIEAQMDPDLLKGERPLWWVVEQFMYPVDTIISPQDRWLAILEIHSRRPSGKVIGMLAAGPLEDLIHYSGPEFIEPVELESRPNPAFRHLLGGGLDEQYAGDMGSRPKGARRGVVNRVTDR